MKEIIAQALKAFKFSLKDVDRIDSNDKDLTAKVYLKRGLGCLFIEGWTEEIRRKKHPDGHTSFFRLQLEKPAFRVKRNEGSWIRVR